MATAKRKRKAVEQPVATQLTKRHKHSEPTIKNPSATLLTIPAELRNSIYEMVLDDIPQRITLRFFHQPAITRVCTQLRQEVLPMVHALLNTREWDFALLLGSSERMARELGLGYPLIRDGSHWRLATLQWQRDIGDKLTTSKTVTFTARVVTPAPTPPRVHDTRQARKLRAAAAAPAPVMTMMPNCYVSATEGFGFTLEGGLELIHTCRFGYRNMLSFAKELQRRRLVLPTTTFHAVRQAVYDFGEHYWDDEYLRISLARP